MQFVCMGFYMQSANIGLSTNSFGMCAAWGKSCSLDLGLCINFCLFVVLCCHRYFFFYSISFYTKSLKKKNGLQQGCVLGGM